MHIYIYIYNNEHVAMGTGDLWYYTGSRYNIVSTSHRIGSEFKFSNSYYTKWDPNIIKILNVYIMNSCRKIFKSEGLTEIFSGILSQPQISFEIRFGWPKNTVRYKQKKIHS